MQKVVNSLDEALQIIADSSFYEDKSITPNSGGTFTVEDAHGLGEELLYWTYESGAEWPKGALDHSRVHESYESYDTSGHIRYNLDAAIESLEEGKPVSFQYVVIDAYDCDECKGDDDRQYEDRQYPDGCPFDHLVGWALIAYAGA